MRSFSNPCDRDPPTENLKNLEFSKISLQMLNVYFWGDNVDFGGDNVDFGGNNFDLWGFAKSSLEVFVFCCRGGFGTLWVGG